MLTLPDSAAGRVATWVLEQMSSRGQGLNKEEVAERYHSLPDDWTIENIQGGFNWSGNTLGDGFVLDKVDDSDPNVLWLGIQSANGRKWDLRVDVAAEPPHKLVDWWLSRRLPDGVEIRPAREEDGPALSEVARRAPVRLTNATITIDPGDGYAGASRIMGENAVTYVATHNGTPIGIHCGVAYPGRFQGTDLTCGLIVHSRLFPEFSGGGIWGRLNDVVRDHLYEKCKPSMAIAYVRPDNASAQRLGGAEWRWATRPFRAVLNCEALAGEAHGREATEADADRVVKVVNECHDGEELFQPYSVERFSERVRRAPDLYGWNNVLVGDGAVVGVWASGETHTRVEDDGDPMVSRRAVALDYGFIAGAEGEFEQLLRAWCARLAPQGITHLGLFSSPASRTAPLLKRLADDIEEYDIMPVRVLEPPTAATNGIYVDAAYF